MSNSSAEEPIDSIDLLLAAVDAVQGVLLSRDDVRPMLAEVADQQQLGQACRYRVRQVQVAEPNSVSIYRQELVAGKALSVVTSGVLGFVTGGWAGAAIGILGALFGPQKPKGPGKPERNNPQTGFEGSGGSLAPTGAPLALIYCNRTLAPEKGGGVRAEGLLLHSRVECRAGVTRLYLLHALGIGQSKALGWGQIGLLNEDEALLNGQPRSNFDSAEVVTAWRPGTWDQTAIENFPYYSQNLSLPDYAVFGVDKRIGLDAEGVGEPLLLQWDTLEGLSEDGRFLEYNENATPPPSSTGATAWSSTEFIEGNSLTIRPDGGMNGQVGFSATSTATTVTYAWVFSGQPTENGPTIPGFPIVPAEAKAIANGVVLATIPYRSGSKYEIQLVIDEALQVRFLLEDNLIVIAPGVPVGPFQPHVLEMEGVGSRLDLRTETSVKNISAVGRTKLIFDEDDDERVDLLTPGQQFSVSRTGDPNVDPTFRVLSKNADGREVTVTPPVPFEAGGDIFAIWTAKFETTKRVHRVELNLTFQLSAIESREKNKNYGKPRAHGSLFDLYGRPANAPKGQEVLLGRFMAHAARPQPIRRWLSIENLPLGRYYFELRPLTKNPGGQTVRLFADSGTTSEFPIVTPMANGGSPTIRGEFQSVSDDNVSKWLQYKNKQQVSTESGPTGKISSINEIVIPGPGVNPYSQNGAEPDRYLGICVRGSIFTSSERMTSAPLELSRIDEGRIAPNYLAAGTASALSQGIMLVDPGAAFNATLASVPATALWVRNLTKRITYQVSSIQAQALTISASQALAAFEQGDRYVVFFFGSSPFWVDHFVDLLSNDWGGIRELTDPDEDIDFESICESRRFLDRKGYHSSVQYLSQSEFIARATDHGKESLLLPMRRNGRYGYRPEELREPDRIFNASEISGFTEQHLDWQGQTLNRLIVTYTDGRDVFAIDGARHTPKTITIETLEAYQGSAFINSQSLELETITNPLHAIDMAVVFFNSTRLQDRQISFSVGPSGIYAEPGDLIRVQHPLLDTEEELSGYVREAEPLQSDGSQLVLLDVEPLLMEGRAQVSSVGGVSDIQTFAALGEGVPPFVVVGDLLRNDDTGQVGLITAVESNRITAPAVDFAQGDRFSVLNLTPLPGLLASARYRETSTVALNKPVQFLIVPSNSDKGITVWLKIWGLSQPLQRLDPVNLGGQRSDYRIQECQPEGRIGFRISALNYPGAALYSQAGLVISYDDTVLGLPPAV